MQLASIFIHQNGITEVFNVNENVCNAHLCKNLSVFNYSRKKAHKRCKMSKKKSQFDTAHVKETDEQK